MICDVEINGRTRRVEVQQREHTLDVRIDDRPLTADVVDAGGVMSLILSTPGEAASGHGPVPRHSYEIAVVEQPGSDALTVHVNGRLVNVTVATGRAAWSRRGQGAAATGKGPQRIAAPMPGKVVKVLVKPGDAVAAGQAVVVVEAMKMENELRVRQAGSVAEVRAVEGALVEAGAVLVTVE